MKHHDLNLTLSNFELWIWRETAELSREMGRNSREMGWISHQKKRLFHVIDSCGRFSRTEVVTFWSTNSSESFRLLFRAKSDVHTS